MASKYEGIVITSKIKYTFVQKVLCCKCFKCCQEEKVMTSDIRKETIKRMMEDYLVKDDVISIKFRTKYFWILLNWWSSSMCVMMMVFLPNILRGVKLTQVQELSTIEPIFNSMSFLSYLAPSALQLYRFS
jgi:hypothetical protein